MSQTVGTQSNETLPRIHTIHQVVASRVDERGIRNFSHHSGRHIL